MLDLHVYIHCKENNFHIRCKTANEEVVRLNSLRLTNLHSGQITYHFENCDFPKFQREAVKTNFLPVINTFLSGLKEHIFYIRDNHLKKPLIQFDIQSSNHFFLANLLRDRHLSMKLYWIKSLPPLEYYEEKSEAEASAEDSGMGHPDSTPSEIEAKPISTSKFKRFRLNKMAPLHSTSNVASCHNFFTTLPPISITLPENQNPLSFLECFSTEDFQSLLTDSDTASTVTTTSYTKN